VLYNVITKEIKMTNKNWCVWSCANGREDELYASGLSEADAELVATECNIVADELGELVEFRPAPEL